MLNSLIGFRLTAVENAAFRTKEQGTSPPEALMVEGMDINDLTDEEIKIYEKICWKGVLDQCS